MDRGLVLRSVLLVGCCLCVAVPAVAQFRAQLPPVEAAAAPDSLAAAAVSSTIPAWEKLAWFVGASVAYAGIDYFGYNLSRHDAAQLAGYRILQLMMHGALTWMLAHFVDIPTAAGWNIAWWTFNMDILYYGFAEIFNPGPGWDSRGAFKAGVIDDNCNWAYWTPVGLVRGARKDRIIPGSTILAQALVGMTLALTVTLSF